MFDNVIIAHQHFHVLYIFDVPFFQGFLPLGEDFPTVLRGLFVFQFSPLKLLQLIKDNNLKWNLYI